MAATITTWEAALADLGELNNPTDQRLTHRRLGYAYSQANRYDDALKHLAIAMAIAEEAKLGRERGDTHRVLCRTWQRSGDMRKALTHASAALDAYRSSNYLLWENDSLILIGRCQAFLGQYDEASAACEKVLHDADLDKETEADALDTLGLIACKTGRYHDALAHYRRGLDLSLELGHLYMSADLYASQGDLYTNLHEEAAAQAMWRHALDLFQTQQRFDDANHIRNKVN